MKLPGVVDSRIMACRIRMLSYGSRRIREKTMNLVRAGWAVLGTLALSVSLSAQGAKRAITFDDMIKLHRVSTPQISAASS